MSADNPWNLFGLDLSSLGARAKLAWSQLLWGSELGLRERFCPKASLCTVQGEPVETGGGVMRDDGTLDDGKYRAVLLDESITLVRAVSVPARAECFLQELIQAEVMASSPFGLEDTVYGYCLTAREGDHMMLNLAMVRAETARACLSKAEKALGCPPDTLEVWAQAGGQHIVLGGFAEPRRFAAYLNALKATALRSVLMALALLVLLSFPVTWLNQYASQLAELRLEVERRSTEIVAVREKLVFAQDRLEAASTELSGYPQYGPWLHKLSELTPDSVYLIRMVLEGDTLTVTGFAENAADYQGALASAPAFSNVTAPLAFTLDARSQRERFTLTMQLNEGSQE